MFLFTFCSDFDNARPLWNSEVSLILDFELQERQLDTAAANDGAIQLIQTTLEYVRRYNNFPNKASIDSAHALVQKYPITPFELAMLNNLQIDDPDECQSLIPTIGLKVQRGELTMEQIEQLLADLKRYQTP